ncbi:hypothetical protein SDC9_197108 [bioreactor metagenome]|uniref:Uncharacterized protein n=1 Tax=bioreactor metagenome TaxID=1076179 RepID=A0A645IDZ8_9ZZZZ
MLIACDGVARQIVIENHVILLQQLQEERGNIVAFVIKNKRRSPIWDNFR